MKSLIVLIVLAVLAIAAAEWTPKTADEVKAARSLCLEGNRPSDEAMRKLAVYETIDEEPVRQFVLCMSKKLGFFCGREGYHPDRIAKQLKGLFDESEALAIAERCADKNEQKSSVDVWAYRGHECLLKSKIGDVLRASLKKAPGA